MKNLFVIDERLGTIALPAVEEGRDQLWPKTVAAFRYVWEHHRNDAEWFLKADDDTWVFTNNLRSFLNPHDPNEQHYFGCHWDSENGVGPTYNHGGTGEMSPFLEDIRLAVNATHFAVEFHSNEASYFLQVMS